MKILQFPLARITVVFVLGILFAHYFKPSLLLVCLFFFMASLNLMAAYFWCRKNPRLSSYFGASLCVAFFGVGISTQLLHTESYQKNHYTQAPALFEKPHTFRVVLQEKLKNSAFSQRYVAVVRQIDTVSYSGKILLNIKNDSLPHLFAIGNRLQIQGNIYPNSTSKNPNQFDYGNYLQNKQIYAQLYSDQSEIKISPTIEKNVWYYAAKIRATIIANLKKDGFNNTELQVAVALILGQQQDIEPEIIKDYQYAGAVHILSVSGLHVGFILFFVYFILKPIPNNRKGSVLKVVLALSLLWLFGILAGLVPSVVRSVTMFSFIILGKYLGRSVNSYHTLLVSILLILLVQPSFLFDVGFQLSYLALFFIFWFEPLLSKIWTPKNKISRYFWSILSVSFAAQIGTLPLSLYYFHQFPGLFFITNLILIPLMVVIMGLGVLVMVLAFFDQSPQFLSKTLEWSLFFIDQIIHQIAALEQFIIKDIPFTMAFLLGSYLLLFGFVLWLKKPVFWRLTVVLLAVIFLQLGFLYNKRAVQNQREWLVFNVKKNTLIGERIGDKVTFYTQNKPDKTKLNLLINGYLVGNFSDLAGIRKLKNTFFFNGKKILVIDRLGVCLKEQQPDIIVLTQSPKINLDRLLLDTKPQIVVADASNYNSFKKRWKASCLKQKIPFHATSEKGFYVLN